MSGPPDASFIYSQYDPVLHEIYTSEVNYLRYLSLVRFRFATSLLLNPDVDAEDHRIIFQHLEAIHSLSCKLSNALRLVHDPYHVGQVFLRFLPFMRCYVPYICKYSQAVRILKKLYKNPNLLQDLRRLEESEGVQQRLEALLIMPIQRIPRYVLLLRELLGRAPPGHPDHAHLTQAVHGMSQLATEINHKLEEQQRGECLLRLHHALQNKEAVQLIQPGRSLVKEGLLSLILATNEGRVAIPLGTRPQPAVSSTTQTLLKPIFLILLNDILVIACPLQKRLSHLFLPHQRSSSSLAVHDFPSDGDTDNLPDQQQTFATFINGEWEPKKYFCENVLPLESVRVRPMEHLDVESQRSRLCHSVFLPSPPCGEENNSVLAEESVENSVLSNSIVAVVGENRGPVTAKSEKHSRRPLSLYASFNSQLIKSSAQLDTKRLFKVNSMQGSWLLYAHSETECTDWVNLIKNTAYEASQRRNTLRLNAVSPHSANSPGVVLIQKKVGNKRKHIDENSCAESSHQYHEASLRKRPSLGESKAKSREVASPSKSQCSPVAIRSKPHRKCSVM